MAQPPPLLGNDANAPVLQIHQPHLRRAPVRFDDRAPAAVTAETEAPGPLLSRGDLGQHSHTGAPKPAFHEPRTVKEDKAPVTRKQAHRGRIQFLRLGDLPALAAIEIHLVDLECAGAVRAVQQDVPPRTQGTGTRRREQARMGGTRQPGHPEFGRAVQIGVGFRWNNGASLRPQRAGNGRKKTQNPAAAPLTNAKTTAGHLIRW